MNLEKNNSRILGAAFLFQFITSLFSNLIMPKNTVDSMMNIANNGWLIRTSILGQIITAMGIIFLGTMLVITLRKENEKIALLARGLYVLEAALLAVSTLGAYSFLHISKQYILSGNPSYLQEMASLSYKIMEFGLTLHMLPFCLGAILFYYLFYKSKVIPRGLSLWGLITVFLCLVGSIFSLYGYETPFMVYVPYVPFEFVVGIWLLVKGFNKPENQTAETYSKN